MKKNNQILGKQMNEVTLYLKAFNSKIIPVILTISSSALGLVPFMMLGKQEPFWYAFSAGSIGGLVFSLLILIIYLPVFLINFKYEIKTVSNYFTVFNGLLHLLLL